MQLTASSIIVKFKNDSNKQLAYKLDDALWLFIQDKKPCLKKLYGSLDPKTTNLIQLTKKIGSDFSLDNLKVKHCPNADQGWVYYSYARANSITFGTHHFNENNIEVAIHEFAHILSDTLFKSSFERHGALFVSILRWLLNFYELVTYEEFDKICIVATEDKVQRTDDTIVSVKFLQNDIQSYVDKFEPLSRESSFYHKDDKVYIQSFKYQENGLLHVLYVNFEENKGTLIKRKLFGFEDFSHNMFKKFSNEKLLNFYLISPMYLMDYDGNKIGNRYMGDFGYMYYKVEDDFDITNNFENVWDRDDYKSQIKCFTQGLKKDKCKYKRCYTYEEFDILQRHLRYEINQRINND